jgi:hypothetical protein
LPFLAHPGLIFFVVDFLLNRVKRNSHLFLTYEMRTCIIISADYSDKFFLIRERILELSELLTSDDDSILCCPTPGNLLPVLRTLSANGIQYQIKSMENEA